MDAVGHFSLYYYPLYSVLSVMQAFFSEEFAVTYPQFGGHTARLKALFLEQVSIICVRGQYIYECMYVCMRSVYLSEVRIHVVHQFM